MRPLFWVLLPLLFLSCLGALRSSLVQAGENSQTRARSGPRTPASASPAPGAEALFAADPAQRGRTLFLQGKYQEAFSVLSQELLDQPDNLGVRLDHARTCLTLGYLGWDRLLIEKAEQDLKEVLAAQPQDRAARELNHLVDSLQKRMTAGSPASPAPVLRDPGKMTQNRPGKLSSRKVSPAQISIDGKSTMVHPTLHGPDLTQSDSDRSGADLSDGVR